MQRRHLLQAASAAIALPGLALAQAYPTKPIRYICPVAAGGGNDMIARVVGERWGRALGQASWSTTRAAAAAWSPAPSPPARRPTATR
jgi:tripartite-type tricarboxylate transporter receptor subunit TctC